MTFVDDFLARYAREIDFYGRISSLCRTRCEKDLKRNGIQAIVSHRAKHPDRLRDKVEDRKGRKGYRSVDDIYDDMVDLAGVRVALYFPSDLDQVDKLIRSRFDVEDSRTFPKDPPERDYAGYKTRFTGYAAKHFHVRLSPSDLEDEEQRYAQARVEIQVASVLMHAWSEVEHDLAYKPASGRLSEDEYAILDELNGLVSAGEIALERLARATRARLEGSAGERFNNHYELAAYVYERYLSRTRRTSDG